MDIVIEKRVSLEFLGEQYKDSHLTFRAMSLDEYEKLRPKLQAVLDKGNESIRLMKQTLKEYFIEGSFKGQPVTKEDIGKFDLGTLSTCFEVFSGQKDPKA